MNKISGTLFGIRAKINLESVPALANAEPDWDPCGGPLKVIVQSKKIKD
jgi:hypothetical protein